MGGIIKRMKDDAYIKRLLKGGEDSSGVLLCEALIQQNYGSCEADELEERFNVVPEPLEGVRKAIFSHCEDDLDALELLLNMPYLPRSNSPLAERAYLRLLEDALFDACEREGEDDILDDLNISDEHEEREKAHS